MPHFTLILLVTFLASRQSMSQSISADCPGLISTGVPGCWGWENVYVSGLLYVFCLQAGAVTRQINSLLYRYLEYLAICSRANLVSVIDLLTDRTVNIYLWYSMYTFMYLTAHTLVHKIGSCSFILVSAWISARAHPVSNAIIKRLGSKKTAWRQF